MHLAEIDSKNLKLGYIFKPWNTSAVRKSWHCLYSLSMVLWHRCKCKTRSVCKTQMPPAASNTIKAKTSKSLHLPKRYMMSLKCEQPFDELTVQVWLLYVDANLKYCTFNVSRITDIPGTFQAGSITIIIKYVMYLYWNMFKLYLFAE